MMEKVPIYGHLQKQQVLLLWIPLETVLRFFFFKGRQVFKLLFADMTFESTRRGYQPH